MGAVYVKVKLLGMPERPASAQRPARQELAGPPRASAQTVEALVDTGVTLSIFPAALLRRLGVRPIHEVRTRLADGRVVRRAVGEVRLKLNGEMVTTRTLFGQAKDATVIGLVALESLGLTVDPIRRRLVHGEFLML